MEKRWLTPEDFEREYDIKKSTQSKMRMKRKNKPRIPHVKFGGFVRYDRHLIDKFFENHNVEDTLNEF